jgi:MFS family permease
VRRIAAILGAVFVLFVVVGASLPTLPLHVNRTLGFGPVVVGAIVGVQFVASLASRPWAGTVADGRGPRTAVIAGLVATMLAGALYLASLAALARPNVSLIVLVAGRAALGCAESMIATGALAWGMSRAGGRATGIIMVWVGNAIFAGWSLGAPLGGAVYARWHFASIGVIALLAPLAALAVLRGVPDQRGSGRGRVAFLRVLHSVALPGLGLALASIGFSVVSAFIALLYAARGFDHASLAFTAFGAAFIVARLVFGHLPDRIGGARVALVVVAVAAAGQVVIGLAATPAIAGIGAALTGFGYSLAFPAFGVEAAHRAPPQARGAAMGAYVMFLDVAMAIAAPVAGWVVVMTSYATMYVVAGAASALGMLVAWRLRCGTRPA